MAKSKHFLAFDLGAESGRAILGALAGNKLQLSEVHRFTNGPIRIQNSLHWDILRLWSEIKTGLKTAILKAKTLDGIGVDTWGVDFALLDRKGGLIGNPYHYRDSRTDGMMAEAFKIIPRQEIFSQTGIQFMQLNTLYQLLAMVRGGAPALKIASTLLMIPDLMNYWLTGEIASEFTIATTSQCFDPRRNVWANPLLERLGIPTEMFPQIVPPGTALGLLQTELSEEVSGLRPVVTAPATHDTGSAVAAIPAKNPDYAWISSGTWSIMGMQVEHPVIHEKSLEYNLTNEGGIGGMFRLSRNIAALWLIQECRRTWEKRGESYSYDDLTRMAAEARPLQSVIDTDSPEFLHPGDMPAQIRAYCQRTGQTIPDRRNDVVRCALESIALKYRWVLERLEEVTGRSVEVIHIVGGGARNTLLCQFAANATRRQVIAGPVEATCAGNILGQALALNEIESLEEAHQIVCDSFETMQYEPDPALASKQAWEDAYAKMCGLIEKQPV